MINTSTSTRTTEILAAAAKVFTERGYDAAAVSDIAIEVGLSKATLYHYFDSKEAILFAIITETLEGLVNASTLSAEATREADAATRLRQFMRSHASFFEANYHAFTVMLSSLGALSEAHRRQTIALRDAYEQTLRGIIGQGVREGTFRDVAPDVAARAVLSMLNWMGRWFKPGGPQRASEVAADYADLLLAGLTQTAADAGEGRGPPFQTDEKPQRP